MNTPPDFFSTQVSEARRFYLNLSQSSEAGLTVACGGCEHSSTDYAIERDGFPYHCIEYVIRGNGSVRLGGRTHSLRPGSIFSYGPGIRQNICTDANEPLVKYFVDFSGTEAANFLKRHGLKSGSCRQVFPFNELQSLFDEMIRSGLRPARHAPEVCNHILECIGFKIADSRAPAKDAETLSFDTYQQCHGHMEEHFMRLKTLGQLARECHVDAAYLCRLFSRYDHESPYKRLMRLKMNRSAEWLLQPGAMVKQVAERAGFADQFHFSRTFKSVFGLAPETFKRLR